MLRRKSHFVSVVLAAASLTGCLGSYGGGTAGPQAGPDPVATDPGSTGGGSTNPGTSPNADRPAANPDPSPGTQNPAQDPTQTQPPVMTGPPAAAGTISLSAASTSESLRLNDSKDLVVSVMPAGGFNGMVVYSLVDAPAGVTATFDPPSAMVSALTTTTLTLKTSSDFKPATGIALKIKGTSGTIEGIAPLTLDVTAELLVRIAKGVAIGTNAAPNLTAFGAQSIPTIFVAPGTKVTFVNDDTINHEIHSDGTLGVKHEGGPLTANAGNAYTQTFNGAGTFNFRCHIHPNMKGQIVVKAAQ
jgi:plastocyanin